MELSVTKKQKYVVSIPGGLHLRPAALLAETAIRFDSDITVRQNESAADAKSALSLIQRNI
jgi:phosphotransferase system HPr (HPr) family protein